MDQQPDYPTAIRFTSEQVSQELRQAFESVAKIALRASARSLDSTVQPLDRIREATMDLSLIVEEAMRGVRQSVEWMAAYAVTISLEQQDATPSDGAPL